MRGRGKSEGERFCVEDIADYVADIRGLILIAKESHPGLPVFLLGHTAGGVVSCTFALDYQHEINGLICESFAFQVPAPGFVLSAGALSCRPEAWCPDVAHEGLHARPRGTRGSRGRSPDPE